MILELDREREAKLRTADLFYLRGKGYAWEDLSTFRVPIELLWFAALRHDDADLTPDRVLELFDLAPGECEQDRFLYWIEQSTMLLLETLPEKKRVVPPELAEAVAALKRASSPLNGTPAPASSG